MTRYDMPTELDDKAAAFYEILGAARGDALLAKLAEVFSQQAHRIETLEAEMRLLALHQAHRSPILAAPDLATEPVPMSPIYSVTPQDYLLERDGFHGIEFTAENEAFRWSAQDGVLPFEFYANRALPLVVSLSILTSIDERNPGAIRLTDDDQIVPLVLSWDAKGARLTGVLPPRDLRGVTRLEFHVPHVSTLSDQDSRIAGVAFRGLEIAPASTEDLDLFDPVPQVAAE